MNSVFIGIDLRSSLLPLNKGTSLKRYVIVSLKSDTKPIPGVHLFRR